MALPRASSETAKGPNSEAERSLFKKMTKYVQNTIKRSTEAILNMVDYRMNNDIEAGGTGMFQFWPLRCDICSHLLHLLQIRALGPNPFSTILVNPQPLLTPPSDG